MIIKPSIRNNVYLNAHPKGCEAFVNSLSEEAKDLPDFAGPKRVLIIGGSSGYGLASRVALAQNAHASTINVSFEKRPSGKRSGTAGFWNNIAFLKQAKTLDSAHYDIIGDAFSEDIKKRTMQKIKETFSRVDLVVYSLAAGARPDPETGKLVYSSLKPIGEPLVGRTIDVANKKMKDIRISPATREEIDNTVYVMGGSDWKAWLEALDAAGCLSERAKTVSYTYVGSGSMDRIYRGGTIGKAKEDLEKTARDMDVWLQEKYNGEALISSSKAVTTKASVFIPGITTYMACLFDAMKEKGTHESILTHKHRLFKDMVYGSKRRTDSLGRLRMDHYEMDADVQEKTLSCVQKHQDESVFALSGTKHFLEEFHHIHGFGYDHIDYEEDLDLDALIPDDIALEEHLD